MIREKEKILQKGEKIVKQQINLNELPNVTDEDYALTNDDFCLTEVDFYPPSDNRVWTSIIEDVNGGDNFVEYCVDFFDMLDEEEYYDN